MTIDQVALMVRAPHVGELRRDDAAAAPSRNQMRGSTPFFFA